MLLPDRLTPRHVTVKFRSHRTKEEAHACCVNTPIRGNVFHWGDLASHVYELQIVFITTLRIEIFSAGHCVQVRIGISQFVNVSIVYATFWNLDDWFSLQRLVKI